jgi:hypothetical protein
VNTDAEQQGPVAYENWRDFLRRKPLLLTEEIPLYSDSRVTGEIRSLGPYSFLNTIAQAYAPGCVPIIVLRMQSHGSKNDQRPTQMEETNTSRFHGGSIAHELAALEGLVLGVRLRPSSRTRLVFTDDKVERPMAENPADKPTLNLPYGSPRMLPISEEASLDATALSSYPLLPSTSAVALSRAALLYQAGMWLAESSPADAWLMFVSAAEVAAVQWRSGAAADDPEQVFRKVRPDWVKRLERTGDATIVRDMAKKWSHLLSATNRFIEFIIAHLPEAPEQRPPVHCVEWTEPGWRTILAKIYEHRSNALHGGIPFPIPMCSLPMPLPGSSVPMETPFGLAQSGAGGVWVKEDYPIHLHVFVDVVRACLLNWWRSLPHEEGVVD